MVEEVLLEEVGVAGIPVVVGVARHLHQAPNTGLGRVEAVMASKDKKTIQITVVHLRDFSLKSQQFKENLKISQFASVCDLSQF